MLGDFNKTAQQQPSYGPLQPPPNAYADPMPTQKESEVQYAAAETDNALRRLAEVIELMAVRLEPVLENHPVPATGEAKAARALSSKLAGALLGHAQQLEGLELRVRGLISRLAI